MVQMDSWIRLNDVTPRVYLAGWLARLPDGRAVLGWARITEPSSDSGSARWEVWRFVDLPEQNRWTEILLATGTTPTWAEAIQEVAEELRLRYEAEEQIPV